VVGEFVAHDSSPRFRGLNHDPRTGLNGPPIRRRLRPWRRFWAKTDINRLTKFTESVEQDPSATFAGISFWSSEASFKPINVTF
jgi:hypothetical protein